MKRFLRVSLAVLAVSAAAAAVWAQGRVYIFNGIKYAFPSAQGTSGQVLTNNGTGGLSWATAASSDALWAGSIVMSSVACPAGWTQLAAADNRVLRGATVEGGTGGADTHVHTISGVTGSTAADVTGATASTALAITGDTGNTGLGSHSHTTNITTANSNFGNVAGGTAFSAPSLPTGNIGSSGTDLGGHTHAKGTLVIANHDHGDGSLAAAAHGHGVGTLAGDSASNLAAHYNVIICKKS